MSLLKRIFASPRKEGYDDRGRPILDPTPVRIPVDIRRHVRLSRVAEMAAALRMVRQEAADAGFESEEEADDFEMEDVEPWSKYEERDRSFDAPPADKRPPKASPSKFGGGPAPAGEAEGKRAPAPKEPPPVAQ